VNASRWLPPNQTLARIFGSWGIFFFVPVRVVEMRDRQFVLGWAGSSV
jgi:hypothetical protein